MDVSEFGPQSEVARLMCVCVCVCVCLFAAEMDWRWRDTAARDCALERCGGRIERYGAACPWDFGAVGVGAEADGKKASVLLLAKSGSQPPRRKLSNLRKRLACLSLAASFRKKASPVSTN